jgi:hypothetical protein
MFVNWLEKTFADVKNREDATERGRKLFREGLIGEWSHSCIPKRRLMGRTLCWNSWLLRLQPLLLPPRP